MTSAASLPPISESVASAALRHISPDCSRADWVRIGFALASEFGANGWPLFDDWSRGADSYDPKAARSTWRSIVRARGGARRASIGTLIHEAQRYGFKFEAPKQTSDEAMAERERRRVEAQRRQEVADRERREAAARAAQRSADRWARASRTGESLYLRRKAIDVPEAVRFEADGTILVPMIRYDRPRESALVGVQAIRADGAKRFGAGTEKAGACCRLGVVVVGEPILVAEGYATGATVRQALGRRLPVFVAFDAGNLAPAVTILRALHPQCPIVICADDDWRTPGNPGRDKARRAARALSDVHLTYPVWPGERRERDTDFNDLHLAAGIGVVARQLRAGLRLLGFPTETIRAA